jgi:hypothetical protein
MEWSYVYIKLRNQDFGLCTLLASKKNFLVVWLCAGNGTYYLCCAAAVTVTIYGVGIVKCLLIMVHSEWPYIHQCVVGNWNKFPSCQCKLLVSWGNYDDQTALKWDRRSYPARAPCCVSHTFGLKYHILTWKWLLQHCHYLIPHIWCRYEGHNAHN